MRVAIVPHFRRKRERKDDAGVPRPKNRTGKTWGAKKRIGAPGLLGVVPEELVSPRVTPASSGTPRPRLADPN